MWQRWNQTTHVFEKSTNDGVSWSPLGLNASIITEGTIDPARLPVTSGGNIAYTDVANIFTEAQTIEKIRPELILHGTGDTVKTRVFQALPDGAIYISSNLMYTGTQWDRDDITKSGVLTVFRADGSHQLYNTPPGANPAALTTTFTVDGAGTISNLGHLLTKGNCNIGNINNYHSRYLYPGRNDVAFDGSGIQGDWYLGSNANYGLYSNTGLYLAGGLWVASNLYAHASLRQGLDPANGTGIATWFVESSNHIRAAGGLYDYARGTPIGTWIAWTPSLTDDAGRPCTYGTLICKYMLVGNTCFYQVYCDNITIAYDTSVLRFSLPVAGVDNYTGYFMTRLYWSFQGFLVGYTYPVPTTGTIYAGRTNDGFAAWLGGTVAHIYQAGGQYQIP